MGGKDMRKFLAIASLCFIAACNDPEGPSGQGQGEGDAVAWFDGLSATVDLYYPGNGALVVPANVTGASPNDIIPLGDGAYLTVNSLSSDVTVFQLDESGPTATVELPAGSNPWAACEHGGEIFVSLLNTSEIAVIDTSTWLVDRFLPAGPNPSGIAAAQGRIFVSHGNYPEPGEGGITVLDPSDGDSIAFIPTPENTVSLRYFPETGMIHAASYTYVNDGVISIIDPASAAIVAALETGGSPGLPILTADGFVAGDGFSSGRVFIYGEDGAWEEWDTGHCITGVAQMGDTLYMTCFPEDAVYKGLLDGPALEGSIQAGDGPQGIAIIER
jgi:hypothetical protein